MADHDSLAQTNEEFYRAFREADIAAMSKVWAESDDVACIHPGWPPLHGRERVLSSWRAILLEHTPPQVTCARVQTFFVGDVALVTCVERVPEVQSELSATNVFHRVNNEWRMVLHQAGPVRLPADLAPGLSDDDDAPTLN
ncbi:MAG: nuclear transport factor 2 family protein [Myxococcota bacterium]